MEKTFTGEVKARIVEVRFALSGKVVTVAKRAGDRVKKGGLLAALDRKILQTELDRQLADYEKTRADFEVYGLQKGEPADDIAKYLKTEKQAQLNASVKDVELTKYRLDQADLFSPVEGLVIDDSGLVPGLYITPSANPFKIIDLASFYFEIVIEPADLAFFGQPRAGEVLLGTEERKIKAENSRVLADGKKFWVQFDLPEKENLWPGLKGKINL